MTHHQGLGIFGWLVLLIFVAVIVLALLHYFEVLSFNTIINWLKNKVTSGKTMSQENNFLVSSPMKNTIETQTCVPHSIAVSDSNDKPLSIIRMGYDVVYKCCIDEWRGYECGKQDLSVFNICKTADVGGNVIYLKQNNNFIDTILGLSLINNMHKTIWDCGGY